MARNTSTAAPADQLLHLVLGGELEKVGSARFADLGNLDIVGVYPSYKAAYDAWKAKAQATVDNARVRYFVVHLHRLLDPEFDPPPAASLAAGRGERR
jgi:hypothetical protein